MKEKMFLLIVSALAIYVVVAWVLRKLRISKLSNKYVFITGCDSGFGNRLAKRLDNMGINVVAGCFTDKGEIELTKACSNKLTPVQIDVTNESSVANAVEVVKKLLPNGNGKTHTVSVR